MPTNVFKSPMSDNDCLNYIRPSSQTQRITSFAASVTVTLPNPQKVCNNQATAAVIAIKLRGDSVFTPYSFAGNQEKVLDPIAIGSASDGTTSEDVIINGIN